MGRKRFFNPHIRNSRCHLFHFILWKTGYYNDPIHKAVPPRDFVYPAAAKQFVRGLPSAVWIGHSTFLVEMDGKTILTDPIWDTHCSPIPVRSLRRQFDPPIRLNDLPPIDLVLLSHNHYDHLDAKTVSILHDVQPQIEWIVPLRLGKWFRRRGIRSVVELGWWDTYKGITAVPTQHFSGRTLWDRDKTLWNGYVLEGGGKRLYFTGDTGYNPIDFKTIGERWSHMDLSLIPIGTYSPQKFMQPVHISPYEAVQIHEEVKSRFSLGMHWKTFRLSDEPTDRPPYDLYLAMKNKKFSFDTFLPIDHGVYVNF